MATKISMAEKEMMAKILNSDLGAIKTAVKQQLHVLWEQTREELEDELNFSELKSKIANKEEQIEQLCNEVNELQNEMREYKECPCLQDYLAAGIEAPEGNRNGYIYSHDRTFMGYPISSKMDLLIVKRLKEKTDVEQPLHLLQEVAEAAHRGLVMSGTFEEARANYETFYNLDFQRYGVAIPRRLTEMKAVVGENLLTAKVSASISEAERAGKLLPAPATKTRKGKE